MHLNSKGEAAMTDVSVKPATVRSAIAGCTVRMKAETFELLCSGKIKKGDAFTVAKTAGILAAKKCSDLIPLCHPLPLDHIEVRFFSQPDACLSDRQGRGVLIESEVKTLAKTGVEMEALTAASIAALTLYDMAKGYDPGMTIEHLHLIKKTGGKSDYSHPSSDHYGE